MISLIMVVISIALFSAMTVLTISYIPAASLQRAASFNSTYTGLKSIGSATVRYFEDHRDINGDVIYPGVGVNMLPVLAPKYGFQPSDVAHRLTWQSFTSSIMGMPAVVICVKPVGTPDASDREVLDLVKRRMPIQSTYIGNSCGVAADAAGGSYLSYWVVLEHYARPPE